MNPAISSKERQPLRFSVPARVKQRSALWFCGGLLPIFILGLCYALSGDLILMLPHDQLDGEVLAYTLRAEHWGAVSYEELMGGMPATGMQMAAPGLVILYLLLPPAYAFGVGYALVAVVAYCGLWLLVRFFEVRPWVAAASSFLFALLPFYSVYGLSIMGVPLMAWAVCKVWNGWSCWSYVGALAISAAFALFSSLVLSGFAVVGGVAVAAVASMLVRPRSTVRTAWLCAMLCVLCLFYLLCSFDLVVQVLGGSGVPSHKSEVVLSPAPFSIKAFVGFLMGGQQHAVSNQQGIFFLTVAGSAAAAVMLFRMRKRERAIPGDLHRLACALWVAFGVICAIGLFYFLFNSVFAVDLRNSLSSSLKSFQADRVYWLYPGLWYFCLAVSTEFFLSSGGGRLWRVAGISLVAIVMVLTFVSSAAQNSMVRTTVAQVSGREFHDAGFVSWREFFAEDLFDDIKEYLGPDEEGAAFVSVGLYPSIPLYNGLYCLDGYSNNYPLAYKHAFRSVIGGELEKSEDLRWYFDDWGNRCYVFSYELGRRYLIPKDSGLSVHDLAIDTQSLRALGGRYVLSAVPLENAQECGLEFLKRFDSSDAFYSLYLYRLV